MKEGVGKAKSTTAQKLAKEVEFRKRQAGVQHKHSDHTASMLERIKRRRSSTDIVLDERVQPTNVGHHEVETKATEVVVSGSGSSAESLGQPKFTKILEENLMKKCTTL